MRDSNGFWMAATLAVGACLTACRDSAAPHEAEQQPIRWCVESVDGMRSTRALMIEDDAGLQRACTPAAEGGGGEAIGIWADYDIEHDGVPVTVKNVFGDVRLIYYAKPGGNPYPGYEKWNYESEELYWAMGGVYTFRAYYPQEEMRNYIGQNSDATHFVVDYNTSLLQRDLLLAYNRVDTRQVEQTQQPVALRFRHAMSALCFKCRFASEAGGSTYLDEDELTSCWLENTRPDFTNIGLMVFGHDDLHYADTIRWIESFQPPAGDKMYYWAHASGIPFGNRLEGTGVVATEALAYQDEAQTTNGKLFARNDGWILVVPQQSDGTVQFCFTTKRGGDAVYRVTLPRFTGTNARREVWQEGQDRTGFETFLSGYRYAYTVVISKSDLTVELGITPWEELHSAYDITF
ncbi:MAG: fimbrillin family protein [Bacteroidaceae bacterium]